MLCLDLVRHIDYYWVLMLDRPHIHTILVLLGQMYNVGVRDKLCCLQISAHQNLNDWLPLLKW